MHCVLVALGSAGDIHPFTAIGKALLARGHRVTLLANGNFEDWARGHGLEFVAAMSAESYAAMMADPKMWDPGLSLSTSWHYVAPTISFIHRWLQEHRSDDMVLAGSILGFGARVARDCLNLPLLTIHLAPSAFISSHAPPTFPGIVFPRWQPRLLRSYRWWSIDRKFIDPLMAPAINNVLLAAGRKPVSRIFSRYVHSPDGVLSLFPDWFAPQQPDWPRKHSNAGFLRFDGEPQALPAAVHDFLQQGDSPVLLTPGSAMKHARLFFEKTLEACRAAGRRAIVVTPYVDQLPPLPDHTLHVPYIQFDAILPHVALLAYHGGIGTCAQALAAAVPHLVVPNAFDQYDNGARIERLGVGKVVGLEATQQEFNRVLAHLTASSAVQERCRYYRQRMDSPQEALQHACAAIEGLYQKQLAAL